MQTPKFHYTLKNKDNIPNKKYLLNIKIESYNNDQITDILSAILNIIKEK